MKAIIAATLMASILGLATPASAQWCKNLPVNDLLGLCPVLDPPKPLPPPPPPPPPKKRFKATGTNDEFAQVRYQCLRETRRPVGNLIDAINNNTMFDACMNAKGWYLR